MANKPNAFTSTAESLRNPRMNPNPFPAIPSGGLFGAVKPRATEMKKATLDAVNKIVVSKG